MAEAIDLSRIRIGQEILVGWRRYARCPVCRQVIWLNKPIFGSWHLCSE